MHDAEPSPCMSSSTADRQFSFDYDPGELRCGRGCVSELDAVLADRRLDEALVVTGSNVGANRAVMGPVEAGLGDRLAGVFAETTPEKRLGTALAAARRVRDENIDALVAVGSGSSLDVAKVVSALCSHPEPGRAAERALDSGTVPVGPGANPVPIVTVPTTLAGADLSVVAGVGLTLDSVEGSDHDVPTGSLGDRRLMPTALCYDLALFETTPRPVLCASAMNGFDKAVECLYSPHATPVTDATAMRALSLVQSGFETLPAEEMDSERLYEAVSGVVLAQYGISTPDAYRASVIHAFAHGFSHDSMAHQGEIHGVLTPHVLELVFDRADGRRDLLAAGFGVDDVDATDDDLAAAIVECVVGVRDDLHLPTRLREVDGVSRDRFVHVAEAIRDDSLMAVAPAGVDPTTEEIVDVLETAW
jgi:alcohol dehydrogenase class IV